MRVSGCDLSKGIYRMKYVHHYISFNRTADSDSQHAQARSEFFLLFGCIFD